MSHDQADGFHSDLSDIPGNLCPSCGDIMPGDGSPCPACRHVTLDDPHCATITGCESCGEVGTERWNLPEDGRQVCEACWLEEGENASHGHPTTPPKPPTPDLHPGPDLPLSTRPYEAGRGASVESGVHLGELNMAHGSLGPAPFRRDHNSTCLLCGTIWYDQVMDKCRKCGGLCVKRSSQDLTLLERRSLAGDRKTRGSL